MTELLILVTAVIFFFIGRYSTTQKLEELTETVEKKLNQPKSFIIKSPDAKELKRRNSPQKETADAMRETLDEMGIKNDV